MIVIDLVILALLAWGVYAGYRSGFITVAYGLGTMLAALVVAVLVYNPLARLLAQKGGVVPSFAAVLAIGIITVLCLLLASFTLGSQLRRVPPGVRQSAWNRWLGAAANLLRVAVILVMALIFITALPLSASNKRFVTDAFIPKHVVPVLRPLQRSFNQHFGSTIADAINFFTVDPAGQDKVDLGFKTTNVVVDEDDEVRMLTYINRERTTRGLQPLAVNAAAQEVARAHSREMFAEGYFSHIDSQGHDAYGRMRAAGIKFNIVGENLAIAPTVDQAHLGLMDSPGHRANILSRDFKSVGIGVIDGGPYGLMVAEEFTD